MAEKQSLMMNLKETKRILRTWMIKERQALSIAQRKNLSQKINRCAIGNRHFKRAKTVALYLGFGSEVQTEILIQAAWKKGKTVLIPMTDYGLHRSYFAVFKKGDRLFKTNRGPLELVQPNRPFKMTSIDLIVVPGLAFDEGGYRLGYGGGVYDRLLARAPKAKRMGLYFSRQKISTLPRDHHDQKLDCIVTEKGDFNLAKSAN